MANYRIIGTDQKEYGPVSAEHLRQWIAQGRANRETHAQAEGATDWKPLAEYPELAPALAALTPPPVGSAGPASAQPGNKLAAGICGILLGSLGVHKFILGYNTPGVIMLLVTVLTCGVGGAVMAIIGIIEGILYLTKSDEEFVRTYVSGRREWF